MIEVINFGKTYGDFTAVEDLSFKIDEGELFGFIGPNGAGKSTTIRFLTTLLHATAGEGIVNGFSVTKQPMDVRRSIGYMPDNFGVYDGMKVWEFLDFFAVAYQIPRKQAQAGDRRRAGTARLWATNADDFVNGLSRGMKQRLCLAKTLVHDPPVLILDEPASGLDPRARLEVKALLKELRRMGKTILISSHILLELADCCTSIGIIERGKLLMQGPIQEVYRQIRKSRHIEMRFRGEAEIAVPFLNGRPEVVDVQIEPLGLTVELQGDDETVQRLLRDTSSQFDVYSFTDKNPTLEDVFMMVTKGLVT